jgi:hypothetical protein
MDPLVEQFWYRGIAEGQPLWQQPPSVVLPSLLPPMLGLAGLYALWRGAGDPAERARWIDYALLLGAALAVALLVTRAGAVAGAYAAVPFGWLLQRWLGQLRAARPAAKGAVMLGALALVLVLVWPKRAAPHPAPQRASECEVAAAAPALAALPRGEILAPIDIGPQLLLETKHTVIASAHHRGERGMHFAIALFLGSPERARTALAQRGTAYLAVCPDSSEIARFRSASPNGFLARLADGQRFDWLEPVPTGTNLNLWRIAP